MSDRNDRDRNDRIQRRAHEIWEREGKPQGRHDDHWSQAEAEIRAEEDAAGAKPKKTAAKEKAPAKSGTKTTTRKAAENLSAVAAGRAEQTGTTKTGGQISRGGASRGRSAKASRKDASSD
ncbi:DUF2934 domain-containing protein [Azospirillum sp. sgz302134]